MNRNEAIITLRANVIYACESAGFNVATINLVTEALDLAIRALEREIEYGQMVVDLTKGETMKSDEWKYDTICDAESATTTDCISRKDALKPFCITSDGTRIPEVDCDNFPVEFSVKDIKEHLLSLPPVTPTIDIVRCGECEHMGTEDCPVDEVYRDDFCCCGIRKSNSCEESRNFCPNCGADMRGDKDEK